MVVKEFNKSLRPFGECGPMTFLNEPTNIFQKINFSTLNHVLKKSKSKSQKVK